MRKKVMIGLGLIMCFATACGNQNITEVPTTQAASSEATTEEESINFVAQGKIALMPFLDSCEDNGYSIENPNRNGTYVDAKAVTSTEKYAIQYFVENQHVFSVTVFADDLDEMNEEGFNDCIKGMAKSLNSNLSDNELENCIQQAYENDNTRMIYDETTMFLYDSSDCSFTVAY